MWESIGAVIGLLLALYGAAELLARLCWRLVFAGGTEPLILSVTAGEEAEYRIRRFAAWVHLCPAGGFAPSVRLDGESEELRRLCEDLGLTVYISKDSENRFTSAE